jgi:hypothetical protein
MWGAWYSEFPSLVPAKIHLDLNSSCSLYRHNDNELHVGLGEIDVDELMDRTDPEFQRPNDTTEWPKWKQELVHEMLHEYQHKVLRWESSFAGQQLCNIHQSKFTGQNHGPDYFTAVEHIAPIFGVSPEQLIEYVR